eukprot:2484288-Prorocentrum_lima.AAC.1
MGGGCGRNINKTRLFQLKRALLQLAQEVALLREEALVFDLLLVCILQDLLPAAEEPLGFQLKIMSL